jgi:hypothetical protein
MEMVEQIDSILEIDTLIDEAGDTSFHERYVVQTEEVETVVYEWDPSYVQRFTDVINPLVEEAAKSGVNSIAVFGGADQKMLESLRRAANLKFRMYTADDILLKTIVRSNPGVVLLRDGRILQKWHYKRVPDFTEIKDEYLQ